MRICWRALNIPELQEMVSAELGKFHSCSSRAGMKGDQWGLLQTSPFCRRAWSCCMGCGTRCSLECICCGPQKASSPETLLYGVVRTREDGHHYWWRLSACTYHLYCSVVLVKVSSGCKVCWSEHSFHTVLETFPIIKVEPIYRYLIPS